MLTHTLKVFSVFLLPFVFQTRQFFVFVFFSTGLGWNFVWFPFFVYRLYRTTEGVAVRFSNEPLTIVSSNFCWKRLLFMANSSLAVPLVQFCQFHWTSRWWQWSLKKDKLHIDHSGWHGMERLVVRLYFPSHVMPTTSGSQLTENA